MKHDSKLMLACLLLGAGSLSLCACLPVAVTAAGIGGSTAVSHTLSGITYRTFSLPKAKVKKATYVALNRMGINIVGNPKTEKSNLDIIQAKTTERAIEIQLETISSNTTRMRVTAKSDGLFYDSATSTEIILQTERVLANQ